MNGIDTVFLFQISSIIILFFFVFSFFRAFVIGIFFSHIETDI